MTMVDERGRIAGRINVVDAAALVVLFVLIPAAVGAYLLFRTPKPALVGVTPRMLAEAPHQRLEIDGTNLRPFMRVTFDTIPANSFLLGSTKYALVDVPELKPGTYDVVLYDYMQEVARLPKAITVAPLASDAALEVAGAFKSAPDSLVSNIRVGSKYPAGDHPVVQVLEVGAPAAGDLRLHVGNDVVSVPLGRKDLRATLRIQCTTVRGPDAIARCSYQGPDQQVIVAPDALITVLTPDGPVLFQIDTARSPHQ